MTLTLDLKPELEERIAARAAAQGVTPEEYLLTIIESSFLEEGVIPAPLRDATLEEFEAALDAFSEGTEHLPVLSPEALTRESIYGHRA